MGVITLTSFINERCRTSIDRNVLLSKFRGNTAVVDLSIYMYKFAALGNITKHMFQLICLLEDSGIQCTYVFDGKPPEEKRETLVKRSKERKEAKDMLEAIRTENVVINSENKQKIIDDLCERSASVSSKEYKDVANMIKSLGLRIVYSTEESDDVCAYLVKNGDADIVISNDSDFVIYGCPIIIRDINILYGTCDVLYNQSILKDLGLCHRELVTLAILVGNDSNTRYSKYNNMFDIYRRWNIYVRENTSNLKSSYSKHSKHHKCNKHTNQVVYPAFNCQKRKPDRKQYRQCIDLTTSFSKTIIMEDMCRDETSDTVCDTVCQYGQQTKFNKLYTKFGLEITKYLYTNCVDFECIKEPNVEYAKTREILQKSFVL